tara:strand:+ start:1096 stop:1590 length:495 start_codon:yes stop_codon:yes gene_type:complete
LIDLKEIKNKITIKKNLYFFIIIFSIFFLDRYSKSVILDDFSDSVLYLNDFLNFDLVWNTGIGFGLFSTDSTLFYNLITLLFGLVVLILSFIGLQMEKGEKIVFSLIIGGALGNFYDRLFFKAVPDFIDIHYGNVHWFTFNVADIFITFGIICLIIREMFVKRN